MTESGDGDFIVNSVAESNVLPLSGERLTKENCISIRKSVLEELVQSVEQLDSVSFQCVINLEK